MKRVEKIEKERNRDPEELGSHATLSMTVICPSRREKERRGKINGLRYVNSRVISTQQNGK